MPASRSVRPGTPDYPLMIAVLALVVFGVVMISSASVVLSFTTFGDNNHLLYRQIAGAVLGIVAFTLVSRIDYHRYRSLAGVSLVLTVGLLLLVVATPLGTAHGTVARRWLQLGPISFQPTELIKLTFIIYLAAWLERRGAEIREFSYGFVPFMVMLAVIAALIMKQPDLGTLTVVVLVAVSMYFAAGAAWSHLGLAAGVAVVGLAVLIKAAPYRLARLTIFLHPGADTSGAGYHVNQALLAIGSGGLLGLGFGHSRQKYNYLPEAATDSIFAIIAEELGLIRASLVLALFCFVIVRGYRIAMRAPDAFGRLLAVGIVTWISAQMIVNIGAMLGVLPLTGVPLPFISYGSSSLVLTLIAAGILVNISRHIKEETHAGTRHRWWNRRTRLAGSGHRRVAHARRT